MLEPAVGFYDEPVATRMHMGTFRKLGFRVSGFRVLGFGV